MSVIKIEDLNKTYKERDIFKKLKGKKEKIGVKYLLFFFSYFYKNYVSMWL